ncbi:long-chain fatty acid--CoA ligase [Sphaerobacter thermophilus]|uniref:AMP-dependent synthetase and ligase n=1 Tax=Sphaerobacter thermophilus (strain ATCC 49802 / DSM 20745 / KCCM 41009 / NCIMB 13125 / S 6022) TaxID=479434 RepID=D1C934_SPHTD|nr:AMP-dependent synthetase and ligase [Sphaerobacter thermophilus DSM 20745]
MTVDGLMMNYPLVLPAIMRRAEALYGDKEIVSRLPDKSYHRYTYADMIRRAKQLAVALQRLGIQPGDRVATLAWNHYQHLEAYFGIPAFGGVLHTLNLRLPPQDLIYVANHAEDRVILVDESLLPLFQKIRPQLNVEHVVVISNEGNEHEGTIGYEQLLASADPSEYREPNLDENQAAAMCYTSGTTGRPKGVVYSHRAIVMHCFGCLFPDAISLRETDVVTPVVPMFHVNAWGLPFTCTMVGAKQVFPGPHLDPVSLAELFQAERVTVTAGVPTIWLGLLQLLDSNPGAYDLSSMRAMLIGGQAAPEGMIRGFRERHNLHVVHGWGMTETTPVGTLAYVPSQALDAPMDEQYYYLTKQGRPLPLIEIRARGEHGLVPWDGKTMGELEIRGPWVARAYYNDPEGDTQFTEDGWFRTGDIVTIDPLGYVQITDRVKDVIKSGGEWISSVALENALMAHPAVAEAAVVAVPHPKWLERPAAVVVLKEGQTATEEELRAHLADQFPKWWLPDYIVFGTEIPRTSTGKFLKSALREQLREQLRDQLAAAEAEQT